MIELHITMTGKSYSPRASWHIFSEDRKAFSTMAEAQAWIKAQYGTSNRKAMYVDGMDGHAKRIGYVIGFRNADWSHAPVESWLQQDWVEFRESAVLDLEAAPLAPPVRRGFS